MGNLVQNEFEETLKEIVRVRYSSPKREKELCLELLRKNKVKNNVYIQAFAHTYLGDYYTSMKNNTKCIFHLKKARDIAFEFDYNDLLVRIYSLLGYYYNAISDNQSALEYYIEGLIVCREVQDAYSEALILNNIGYNLQCSKGYPQALEFYKKAYKLFQQYPEQSPLKGIILNNLASVSILLKLLDEAKEYIIMLENECMNNEQNDVFRSQNWCQYYVDKKEIVQAVYWADYFFTLEKNRTTSKYVTFDICLLLFDSMMEIHNEKYSHEFLLLMKKHITSNSFVQLRELENRKIVFHNAFTNDNTILYDIYKNYAKQVIELDGARNTTVTNGLKDMIKNLYATQQKEELYSQKSHLDIQVNKDELTKVFSRHYLDLLIEKYENQVLDTIGFIMIDVDCLKEYNDTYGHVEGDIVLQFVGSLLNLYKFENIYPCRFGGDEFVCLCVNCSNNQLEDFIEKIRKDLLNKSIPHKTSRCAKQVTLSIGFSNSHKNINLNEILELADQALYRAKQNGRNTYSKIIL